MDIFCKKCGSLHPWYSGGPQVAECPTCRVTDKKQPIGFDRITYKREDGSEIEIIPGTKADAERMGLPYVEPKQTVIEREVDNWQADLWQPNADGPGPRIYPEAAFEAGIRRGIEMAAERLEEMHEASCSDCLCYETAAEKIRSLLTE